MKGIPNKFYAKIGLASELPCVILFGIAFLLVFTGFDTQAFITETALQSISNAYPGRIAPHAGYYGMCITYLTFTISTIFSPLIVSYLTAKWTMFLASTLYTVFMITFMLVNSYIFYIASALMGIAAAPIIIDGEEIDNTELISVFVPLISPNNFFLENGIKKSFCSFKKSVFIIANAVILCFCLLFALKKPICFFFVLWTAHGVYMKEITTPGNESRNSGLHWSINFGSLAIGGILLLVIFNVTGEGQTLTVQLIRYIFGGLSTFTILSNILFALLPNYSRRCSTLKRDSFTAIIGKSFRLLFDIKMHFLAVCFLYMGLSLSFYLAIYPSCLSFSKSMIGVGNQIIAYYAFITSLSQIFGGCFISYMSKRILNFGYMPTMLMAIPLYLIAFLGIYLAFPADANLKPTNGATYLSPSLTLWFVIGMLICVGDSFWNTLRTAVLTKMYSRDSSSQAFALSKFFQSTTTCASFFYSSKLNLHSQMIILSIGLIFASICFAAAWRIHLRELNATGNGTDQKLSVSVICNSS